jgi:hypothetical protein
MKAAVLHLNLHRQYFAEIAFKSSQVLLVAFQLFPRRGTPGTAWYGWRYGCHINITQ